ncbi:MAG: hypothetical protein VXZ82_16950 [Planctomycetota bacterium]|nr:hypothetical protein [Planctomycetota bacterium]
MSKSIALLLAVPCLLFTSIAAAQEEKESEGKGTTIKLGRSENIVLEAPAAWKKVQPRSRILNYEFAAPADAKKGDPTARVTLMGAGGSIEANIDRWYGQFKQADGSSTKEASKVEKFEVDGNTVHWVDIPGTFSDRMGGGPFAPGKVVERADYRMLGAIIVTKKDGQYFVKMTGPADLLEKQVKGFQKMLKGLKVK